MAVWVLIASREMEAAREALEQRGDPDLQEARAAAVAVEQGRAALQHQLLQLQGPRATSLRDSGARLTEMYRQQQRAAAARCREIESHRDTWRVSKHRMLLWAEVLGAYESLLPSPAADALLDSTALADLLEQHRRRQLEENFGLELEKHSSGLVPVFTRKATRISPPASVADDAAAPAAGGGVSSTTGDIREAAARDRRLDSREQQQAPRQQLGRRPRISAVQGAKPVSSCAVLPCD
ncbi:hypothetical protein cyc_08426 [Cyclospora cayetanensis]|uniref:Uncharacterized protein n=1 Tax=Cyclospora cayetanensis TaxID=88456 RepID=A0A1D3CT13_9EIME|nr:hypothetical protein cyc_08426 [Cyclospora cayetanensis]